MNIKKLNKTHNVYKNGHAIWAASFNHSENYTLAIVKMYEAFGMGTPYMNCHLEDSNKAWMFRNRDPGVLSPVCHDHVIYLTTEEQITLLTLVFDKDD